MVCALGSDHKGNGRTNTELWEPCLTMLHDFTDKPQNLIGTKKTTLQEGDGYKKRGVYRGRFTEQCALCIPFPGESGPFA